MFNSSVFNASQLNSSGSRGSSNVSIINLTSLLSGETLEVVLDTKILIICDQHSGEENLANLYIPPREELSATGYTGEDLKTSLAINLYFYPEKIPTGELSTTDLDIHISIDLGTITNSTGEEAAISFITSSILEANGSSGERPTFDLSSFPSVDLGEILNPTGETSLVSLITTSIFRDLGIIEGQNASIVFTTALGQELTLTCYTGSYETATLSTVSLLDGSAATGQISNLTLSTFISSTIVPFFYPGTTATATLRTIDSLVSQAYTGQNTVAALIDYPAIPLYPIGYSGETADAELLPGITFPSIAYDGAYGTFDLDYVVNTGMPAGWFGGERVDFTLSTTDAILLVGYAGESTLLYFGTSFALYPTAYSGSQSTADLTLNFFDQIDSVGYTGQFTSATFNTTTRLPNIGNSGETLLFDLLQSPQPNILLISYSGEVAVSSIQISFQIPVGPSYSGSVAVVNQIDTEPNIRFYADSTLSASFSTSDALKPTNLGAGENCYTTLLVGKSEGLGSFGIYSGTNLLSSFSTVHHADLYVMYRTSVMTQVDIGSTTYFDLNTDTCCGVRRESTSNNLLMHLFVKDYLPEAISDGDRVVFSVDLRCNPRLSLTIGTGSSMALRDYNNFLTLDFAGGSYGTITHFDADLTNRLCKGYFVPNGNWLVVEMNDVLPEDCYTDVFYSGTTMACWLSDDCVLKTIDNFTGEILTPSLTTVPPWLFIFYAGEVCYLNLYVEQAIYPRGYTGETLSFKFYEEPLICIAGETGECDLSIEYHVRFKETGCLENNFTFQNDAGDMIPELSNPVPVEGEPFYHSILGECY